MNDLAMCSFILFAALAPAGAVVPSLAYLGALDDAASKAVALALISSLASFCVLVAAAALSGPFLDLLDITPENFQLAAAAVMALSALRLLWTSSSVVAPANPRWRRIEPWIFPVAIPALAGPAAVTAAMASAGRFGHAVTGVSALAALALAVALLASAATLQSVIGRAGLNAAGRLSGALLLIAAAEMALDGVHSV
jgi:multiple antibiotic resistance protein